MTATARSTITEPGDATADQGQPPGRQDRVGHPLRRTVRRRFVGKKFAALEEIWLDAAYAETLTMTDLSESLYLHYRTRLGLWITRAEDRIGLGHV